MKKNIFARNSFIFILLSIVLISIFMLNACGGANNSGGGSNTDEPAATTTSAAATEADKTSAASNVDTLSLVIERPIFSKSPQGTLVDDTWIKETEKYLDVALDITFIETTFGDYNEKLQTYLAAGDWSDIFYAGGNIDQINEFGTSGLLLNTKKYLNDSSFYFTKLQGLDLDPITAPDDGIYVFTSLLYSTNIGTQVIIMVNTDVFMEHDLQAPGTTEELYEVAKKLKVIYPDLYPIGGGGGNGGMLYSVLHLAHGLQDGVFYNGSQFDYAPRHDNYREMITFIHRLFSEGLLDPEFYTTNDDNLWAKYLTGKSFIGFGYGSPVYEKINSAFDEYGVMFGYIPHISGIPGQIAYSPFDNPGKTILDFYFAVINSKTKNPELAMKFLDYQYSEQMLNLFNWGVEGVTYTLGADGSRKMTDEIMSAPNPSDIMANYGINTSYSVRSGVQFVPQDRDVAVQVFPPTPAWKNGNFDTMTTSWAYYDELIKEGKAQRFFETPRLKWTESEVETRNAIRTALDTFAKEERVKFIIGDRPIGEWDKYLSELNAIGDIEQLLKLYNDKLK